MGIKGGQYSIEQKEEILHLLSGNTALKLGREHNISPQTYQPLEETIPKGRAKWS